MLPGRERIDPETARLIDQRLERLLAENAPRRANPGAVEEMSGPAAVSADPEAGREPDPVAPAPAPGGTGGVPPEISTAPGGSGRVPPEISTAPGGSGGVPPEISTVPAGWGPRRFTRTHLVILGALLVLGVLGAGWGLLRARPVPLATAVPVPAPSSTASSATTGATPGSSTPPTETEVVVHVLGAVKRPGLVRLPEGSRVQDAIDAAGGLHGNAEPGELNLAQPVTDGQQIVIGTERDPAGEVRGGSNRAGGGGATDGGAALDLNAATGPQLEQLPGVGPVTAAKIIGWRDEHGRFSRIEELQEVPGIGPKTFAEIAPHVRV